MYVRTVGKVNPQVALAVVRVDYSLSGAAAEEAAKNHVWLDLVDPNHPDFTTVAALAGKCLCVCVYVCVCVCVCVCTVCVVCVWGVHNLFYSIFSLPFLHFFVFFVMYHCC